MSITFRCEKCHKTIEAPDSAAGRRGKCPRCGQSSYIPSPVSTDEIIPLVPLDESEERRRRGEIQALIDQERDLLHEVGGGPQVPLEHKEDLSSADLHHFVVNYCMDMFNGDLERAGATVQKMQQFRLTAIEAVEDFETRKAGEMSLDVIPRRVLEGFLKELKQRLKE